MPFPKFGVCCAVTTSFLCATSAFADVGVIAQVLNGEIVRNGQPIVTELGTLVEQGDILTTEADGLMQIQMADGTQFMVWADTTISIDTALIGNEQNTFETLSVGVTAGIFRFVSGGSDADAYEYTTPAATMGIRGTTVTMKHQNVSWFINETDDQINICVRSGPNGPAIESTCTINSGQCEISRVETTVETVAPDLPEQAEPLCFVGTGIFLPGFGDADACPLEGQCENAVSPFTDEQIETLQQTVDSLVEQGALELIEALIDGEITIQELSEELLSFEEAAVTPETIIPPETLSDGPPTLAPIPNVLVVDETNENGAEGNGIAPPPETTDFRNTGPAATRNTLSSPAQANIGAANASSASQ